MDQAVFTAIRLACSNLLAWCVQLMAGDLTGCFHNHNNMFSCVNCSQFAQGHVEVWVELNVALILLRKLQKCKICLQRMHLGVQHRFQHIPYIKCCVWKLMCVSPSQRSQAWNKPLSPLKADNHSFCVSFMKCSHEIMCPDRFGCCCESDPPKLSLTQQPEPFIDQSFARDL